MSEIRDHLLKELERRKALNSRYSLRAFARYLRTDPSTLSRILRDKTTVRADSVRRFGKILGLRENEIQSALLASKAGTRKASRELSVREDEYRLIADWYHYAVFELFAIPGFVVTPSRIAHHLGITVHEAGEALKRLERLGAIEKNDRVGYCRKKTYLTTHQYPTSSSALRMSQRQALDRARTALDSIPYERREQIGLTIAARSNDIQKIKERIRQFHKRLNDWIEKRGLPDTVYVMTTALVPVSKTSQRRKRK